ncbi:hypothetical protein ENSA5_56090 [Enhygromyxa salina]|uniref:Uncharacterized protein n=1 Tax=Enhygromyxa salina TaxID=215803 RepID=A0A2S9XEQ1_9BACT|nr:SIR2 family protein [Enhygromyxa salina]PRP91343.1 hypothetical protein ENSA5_56090 [Enhygromyxa salina]
MITREQAQQYAELIERIGDAQVESLRAGLTLADPDQQLARLVARYREDGIALVLGAGVSAAAGVPTWRPLMNALLIGAMTETLGVAPESATLLAQIYSRAISESAPVQARYLSNMLSKSAFVERLRDNIYQRVEPGLTSPMLRAIALLCQMRESVPGGVKEVITYNFDVLLEEALTSMGRAHTVVDRDSFIPGTDLPIRHVHGWLARQPDAREWIVFGEDEFHEKFADPFDWSNVVQLNAFSQRSCLFVGLSMQDVNLRRLLDAVSKRRAGASPQHFVLLPRTTDDALRDAVGSVFDWREHDDPDLVRRLRWLRELADFSKQQVLLELGVSTIWFEGFEQLPGLVERVRDC